jgi:transcriptional regulator with XRE-family HTH domain
MSEQRDALIEEFKDKVYRHGYAEEFISGLIATQIKLLREDRNLTQSQLAELTEMKQARISLIESGDYSALNIRTLQRFSEAFDVALTVRFEPFSQLIELIESVSKENLSIKSFNDELPVLINKVIDQDKSGQPKGFVGTTNNLALHTAFWYEASAQQGITINTTGGLSVTCNLASNYIISGGSTLSNQFRTKIPSIPSEISEAA